MGDLVKKGLRGGSAVCSLLGFRWLPPCSPGVCGAEAKQRCERCLPLSPVPSLPRVTAECDELALGGGMKAM